MRALRVVAAALAVAAAVPAAAQEKRSPRWGAFEFTFGGYRPNIDAEFGGRASPYHDIFGGSRALIFRADFAWSIFSEYGSLDLGVGAGYFQRNGKGLLADGTVSGDSTSLRIVPTRLTLTYRFDILADRYGIPLAPYARIAFDHYFWWVTNGSGNTAQADVPGKGGTNGYSLCGGVAFLLDFLDPNFAREMDRDTGVNHTYVFVDFTKSYIRDFGSSKSWDLSDDQVTISGGLLFVF